MMTAIRYPCRSERIRLCNNSVSTRVIEALRSRYLTNVDLPAPRNPQIIVSGTVPLAVAVAGAMTSSVFRRVLEQWVITRHQRWARKRGGAHGISSSAMLMVASDQTEWLGNIDFDKFGCRENETKICWPNEAQRSDR